MPPFMRQWWRLPHSLTQCMSLEGWGKLVNAALLSLMRRVTPCVSVCCPTLLLSELVGLAYVQAWSSNPRGRACRPNGKGSGEEGILSGVVPDKYIVWEVAVVMTSIVLVCLSADVNSADSHSNDDDSVRDDRLRQGGQDDDEELPVYLWRPGQTTDIVGQWEQHTRVSNTFIFILCNLQTTV